MVAILLLSMQCTADSFTQQQPQVRFLHSYISVQIDPDAFLLMALLTDYIRNNRIAILLRIARSIYLMT